jgi:DNA repair exonuclease SbcCD ATPase subunit
MFEISVKHSTGVTPEIAQLSATTFKLSLSPDQSLDLEVKFLKSHLWDQFQKILTSLTETQSSFESFKEEKAYEFSLLSSESHQKISNLELKIENLSSKTESLQNLNKSLMHEKSCIQDLLNHERDFIKTLQSKIKSNFENQSEALKKAEDRDSSFISRLAELSKENLDLQQEVQQLKFALEEVKTQSHNREGLGECLKCCQLSEEIAFSHDFYQVIGLSQENLEVLMKNMCRVNEATLNQVSFTSFAISEENEKLKNEIKTLNETLNKTTADLDLTRDEKSKLFKELSETEVKMNEKMKEFESFCMKTKFDTENNAEVDSFESNCLGSYSNLQIDESKGRLMELETRVKDLEENNSRLRVELCQLKTKTIQEIKTERMKVDSLDLLIEKFCFENGIDNHFVKVFAGVYLFGNKQVNVSLEKDQIFCRYGGFCLNLASFLKNEQGKSPVLSIFNSTQEKPVFSPRLKHRRLSRENEIPLSDERRNKEKISALSQRNKRIW